MGGERDVPGWGVGSFGRDDSPTAREEGIGVEVVHTLLPLVAPKHEEVIVEHGGHWWGVGGWVGGIQMDAPMHR